jgi:hypothetical protein
MASNRSRQHSTHADVALKVPGKCCGPGWDQPSAPVATPIFLIHFSKWATKMRVRFTPPKLADEYAGIRVIREHVPNGG